MRTLRGVCKADVETVFLLSRLTTNQIRQRTSQRSVRLYKREDNYYSCTCATCSRTEKSVTSDSVDGKFFIFIAMKIYLLL